MISSCGRAATVAALALTSLIAPAVQAAALPARTAAAGDAAECGKILVTATDWLGGQGVDVHKNVRGRAGICNGRSISNPTVQYGSGWDCFELAARLYWVKGWGRVGTTGGADSIPEGSPWLAFHPNGDGWLPVAGDLIIERYSDHGHVTVVDRVADGRVYAVEQNATDTGRKTYELNRSAILGAYNSGYVRGFMHSRQNTGSGPLQAAPMVAAAKVRGLRISEAGPAKILIRWRAVKSALPVSRVVVQVGKQQANGLPPATWRTKATHSGSEPMALIKRLKTGTYQFRAIASSAVGPGAYAITKFITVR